MAVRDDPAQAVAADEAISSAELIVIPLATLCEFVWVLQRVYRKQREAIAASVQSLIDAEKVKTNIPAVESGLRFLQAGGDFADGAIASEGFQAGGEVFVTFDRKAATLIAKTGQTVKRLS